MPLFSKADRPFAAAVAKLVHCNPFLPERIEAERAILGKAFEPVGADWNVHPELRDDHSNLASIRTRAIALADAAARRLAAGEQVADDERAVYEDLALFVLYHNCRPELSEFIVRRGDAGDPLIRRHFDRYQADARRLLQVRGIGLPDTEIAHLFACFFQIRRAFHHIFQNIIGISGPAARFRAAVWQSIFTHDMRRYRRLMHARLGDYTTLVTGPSGTGKELAARAIALSRYVPFDPVKKRFAELPDDHFYAINLSAMPPTLIESELMGHRRGAFTGAIEDRAGWFETCPTHGTVFLDEIGDLDAEIQLKLLRVLQERTFQRVGDRKDRTFAGKIIAATHRDLADRVHDGTFREDFYYRLCADQIRSPGLHERLRDTPEELHHLVRFLARRLVDDEADVLADEVVAFVREKLGDAYPWPGNVRELEQCVRNVLIRREYAPVHAARVTEPSAGEARSGDARDRAARAGTADSLADELRAGRMSADELLRRYCRVVYEKTGSYVETARVLGLDRRTVRARLAN